MMLILGSQSPRRRELLEGLLPEGMLRIVPPQDADEPGFDGLTSVADIEQQLLHIVELKLQDVHNQLDAGERQECCILCADTIVVVQDGGKSVVLGKPPAGEWQPVVREWFRMFYSGTKHEVWSAVMLLSPGGAESLVVKTEVRMPELEDAVIDWYLNTGEPVGKAGGYGIQGQAAVLVEGLTGSLSNVIGLPVLEVRKLLTRAGVIQ